MKKIMLWGFVIILALLAYFIFTLVFTWLFQTPPETLLVPTNTPIPTFTPTSTATPLVLVGVTPATPTPSSTPSTTPVPTATPTELPTATPTPVNPQVVSSVTVNIRFGPGTNDPVMGSLPPGNPVIVVGRNEQGSWWQIQFSEGAVGWVANSVVEAKDVGDISIAQAPPLPEPTATPVPPTPTRPPFQFEPTGWYGDTNYGLTRFLGTITDVNGNPVNGVFVEAQCGTYHVISNPSGPVAGSISNDSVDDPPGFYDITIDKRPVPCEWLLTVVSSADGGRTVSARLSDAILIETTIDKSIIVANWRKNW